MEKSIEQEPVVDKVVMDLVNAPKTCPICGRAGEILDEGCCVACWESEILPYKWSHPFISFLYAASLNIGSSWPCLHCYCNN